MFERPAWKLKWSPYTTCYKQFSFYSSCSFLGTHQLCRHSACALMSLCQTVLWHSEKHTPSFPLSASHTCRELAGWSFPHRPRAGWVHTSQLSGSTETPCKHGLLAVAWMELTFYTNIDFMHSAWREVVNETLEKMISDVGFSFGSQWCCLKQTTLKCNRKSLCHSTTSSRICSTVLYIWHVFWMSHVDVEVERVPHLYFYHDFAACGAVDSSSVSDWPTIRRTRRLLWRHTCRKADASHSVMWRTRRPTNDVMLYLFCYGGKLATDCSQVTWNNCWQPWRRAQLWSSTSIFHTSVSSQQFILVYYVFSPGNTSILWPCAAVGFHFKTHFCFYAFTSCMLSVLVFSITENCDFWKHCWAHLSLKNQGLCCVVAWLGETKT